MTDQQQPHSGSRWEPAPPDAATPSPPVHAPVNPVPYAGSPSRARATSRPARGRRVLAGATVGLVAASALGGFALGHLNAPASEVGRTGQVGSRLTPDRQAPPAPTTRDDDGGGSQGGNGSVEGTDTAYHS